MVTEPAGVLGAPLSSFPPLPSVPAMLFLEVFPAVIEVSFATTAACTQSLLATVVIVTEASVATPALVA